MFRIPSTLKATSNDVLATVSAASGAITSGANSLAALAEAGNLHAQAYLETTAETLEETANVRRAAAIHRSKLAVAREVKDIERELDADPELAAIFDSLDDSAFLIGKSRKRSSSLSVAAE